MQQNLTPDEAQTHSNRLFKSLLRGNPRKAPWPIRAVMDLLSELALPRPTTLLRDLPTTRERREKMQAELAEWLLRHPS